MNPFPPNPDAGIRSGALGGPRSRKAMVTVLTLFSVRLFSSLAWGTAFLTAGLAEELSSPAPSPGMVSIPTGVYRPLFRAENDPREIVVKPFLFDAFPVSNGDFLEFVRANPKWRRSQVKRLFAEEGYLNHWAGDLDLGPDAGRVSRQPVTHVSWFAAKAYASWRGKRLPTVAEWEYAASVGFTRPDGTNDVEFIRAIQRWYSTPSPEVLPAVESGRPNYFGVHNLHGLVWEWTSDFNSAMVTGDARGDTGLERQLFCGAGSQGAGDRADFAAFMRYGFRSSLKAGYTVHNLGFRCAKDRSRQNPHGRHRFVSHSPSSSKAMKASTTTMKRRTRTTTTWSAMTRHRLGGLTDLSARQSRVQRLARERTTPS